MTTQYLYGIDPAVLTDMRYKAALEYKLLHAKELYLKMMMDKRYNGYSDDERSFYVWKAIAHTQKLLAELNER